MQGCEALRRRTHFKLQFLTCQSSCYIHKNFKQKTEPECWKNYLSSVTTDCKAFTINWGQEFMFIEQKKSRKFLQWYLELEGTSTSQDYFFLCRVPPPKKSCPISWSVGQQKRKDLSFQSCPFSRVYNLSTSLIYRNFYIDINVYFYVYSEHQQF